MPSQHSAGPNKCWLISGATSAITNSRLISLADDKVSFSWKDYRQNRKTKVMTLDADEFIRRFLLHTLPDGFHRIRHYGFFANGGRNDKIALVVNSLLSASLRPIRRPVPIPSSNARSPSTHCVPRTCPRDPPFRCDTS
jgi:hypothetical protein